MISWNIYRLEHNGSGLVAKHLMQVKAKNDIHALHIAMTQLRLTDPKEQRRLCARDVAYDDWHRPLQDLTRERKSA
jgi:hypothetical protein